SVTFSTTGGRGGVGGDTGILAGAFTLAAGAAEKAAANRNQKRIDGERVTMRVLGDKTTWDTPPRYINAFDSFWGLGGTGGQQDRTDYHPDKSQNRQASNKQEPSNVSNCPMWEAQGGNA